LFTGHCFHHDYEQRYIFSLSVFYYDIYPFSKLEIGRIYKISLNKDLSEGKLYYLTDFSESLNELYFHSVETGEPYNPGPYIGGGVTPYFALVNYSSSNNAIAIGQSAYTITDNQVILGKHPNVQPDTGFAVGVGEDT
jgi:hypothetical protein